MTKAHRPLRVWVLAGPHHDDRLIGALAVPGRLPAMDRWPGETLDNFLARLATAAGDGPDFLAIPIFER